MSEEPEEGKVFLYEHKNDYISNDNIRLYLKEMGRIPMFSRENQEEKVTGAELCRVRKALLDALIAMKPSKDKRQQKARKKILAARVQKNPVFSRSHKQRKIKCIKNIWEFIGTFQEEFSAWPSFNKIREKLEEQPGLKKNSTTILGYISKIRLEDLSEELKLRFQLEKNIEAKKIPKLCDKIFLRITLQFKNPEAWKYWQADLFDELETIPFIPPNILSAIQTLLDVEKKFVEANLRLSVSVAKKNARKCFTDKIDFLDLIQEGNLALYYSARRFDPTMGCKFSTFAMWWIKHAVQRTMDNDSNTIRIPVHTIEKFKKLSKLSIQMTCELGRKPAIEELTERAIKEFPDFFKCLTSETVKNIFDMTKGVVSLDEIIDAEDGETCLGDLIKDKKTSSPEDTMLKKSLEEMVDRIFNKILSEKEIKVINLRFGRKGNASHTLEEVGAEFFLTRERIRQIEDRALFKLRRSRRKEILRSFLT